MKERPIMDISQFCGDESTRHVVIRKPFRVGDWIYATDDCICVRVPARSEPVAKVKVPPVLDLFSDFHVDTCITPWPRGNGQFHVKCRRITLGDDRWSMSTYKLGFQKLDGLDITGHYWYAIHSLGSVFYRTVIADRQIHFVCGELQGIVLPVIQTTR
jgi:hypothetical protein